MNMELISQLFELVVLPLLGVLTAYAVKFIQTKIDQIKSKTDSNLEKKYIEMLNTTITSCVLATTQTYVDNLKSQGKFDAEAQKIAFSKTYQAVLEILSEDAKLYLNTCLGDLNSYISQKIESEVKIYKEFYI